MRFKVGPGFVYVCLLALSATARGGDWPMWRYDSGRSAATPDALPAKLQLRWVRGLPPARPAWPASQAKLQFDANYQPIVVGELLFVGSSTNDSVTAYNTESGEEVWRFYTEGPVRFAPAALGERIYVGSDDGYLYCLRASDGVLQWKVRGGPSDRRIIGNDRLVSSWPIRGGPVISNGTVYFTASIWPFMGIFVHAVDAETGNTVWINSETGSRWVTHPHGAPSFGSVVPQGYLASTGGNVIVPGGRSLPAVFDGENGQLKHFQFGGKGAGGWHVVAHPDFYVVGKSVLAASDGAALGSFSADVLTTDLLITGSTARALTGDAIQKTVTLDPRGKETTAVKLALGDAWPVAPGMKVQLMAGGRVYASRDGEIACFDVAAAKREKKAQPALWSTKIDGRAASMLAADDKLFVVTDDARILCFAAAAGDVQKHSPKRAPLAAKESGLGKQVISQVSSTEGYAVALGIGSGSLIREVLATTDLHVVALDADAAKVGRFRLEMDAAGLYGMRVVAHVDKGDSIELPPYLAELVFGEEPVSPDAVGRILRVLRPYGGVLCLPLSEEQHRATTTLVGNARENKLDLQRVDDLTVIRRSGALPGAGEWTHQYADAGNSVVSKDQLVKAPLGLLWFGGPSHDEILPRHGHGPSPQVAGGRLVIEGPDMLRSVDVYTGRVMWQKNLPGLGQYYDTTKHFPGAGEIGSNYVTLADAVYVSYGTKLLELDAKTGKTRKEFQLESRDTTRPPSWGYLAADGDLLIASSSPVAVEVSAADNKSATPEGMTPVIKPGASWDYLAGADPPDGWPTAKYRLDKAWKSGRAGFGYGDDDDRTALRDMADNYTRVYVRTTFDAKQAAQSSRMVLAINYDDAVIAYLNGKEILRAGVKEGRGKTATGISGHEAGGHELFEIKNFRDLLVPGNNIVAIEGHNSSKTSSDFTLDPYLLIKSDGQVAEDNDTRLEPRDTWSGALDEAKYSSASRRLVVFDRHSGKQLWSRTAEFNFRHNCIAVADGKVFCIDSMTAAKLQSLKRRGIEPSQKPRLLALDAKSGKELWSIDENIFGTFLNYSAEHGVLLQAGSKYRDRAKDEVGSGMVAYRADNGEVLWNDLSRSHGGPCLLWRDKIITNGGGGGMFELLTGKAVDWRYTRMYGCNTAVGSQHLLTFRSGAAGFCDLTGDSGTGNIGGFRSSCTANLIVADGVLNAPDYTRTCNCAYQNQCSLALIHMPEAEMWTFSSLKSLRGNTAVNLGAPGDRRDTEGTLWLEAPAVGGASPDLPVKISGDQLSYIRHHASLIDGEADHPWVAASCAVGLSSVVYSLPPQEKPTTHTLRLHFAELAGASPGERVFDVSINGKRVIENLDVANETGSTLRALVKEIKGVRADNKITVSFTPRKGRPCLSGIEVISP